MNLWIRVDADLKGADVVWKAAEVLRMSRGQSVGHLVMFWGGVAKHASGGDISDKTDRQLEDWAAWDGEPGAFASFVREHCVTDGVVKHWDDTNGPLEERRRKDRERKARARSAGSHADSPQEVPKTSARTEQNRTEQKKSIAGARKPKPTPPEQPSQSGPDGGVSARTTWLTPLVGPWEAKFGEGSFNAKKVAGQLKEFAALLKQRPPEEVRQRLTAYLEITKPQFASLSRFCETYAAYAAPAEDAPYVGPLDGWMSPELERLTRPS